MIEAICAAIAIVIILHNLKHYLNDRDFSERDDWRDHYDYRDYPDR